MKNASFRKMLLCTVALSLPSMALAQNTDNQDNKEREDEIIVTGVVKAGNKLHTSISVSVLDYETIEDNAPRGTSEIFRYLPGIRSESSAGGGNSNIAVRGMPLSTGGAKFLSLQEDGLPILLFGDIDFAPADGFFKADSNIARVESVRGGSASTLTTNGPGGIINFINKNGEVEGGSAAFSTGLDYGDYRVDAEYGGPISDSVYFHVGGHYQEGGRYRQPGFNTVEGGQFRASITKEFEGGFFRVYAKVLDKKDATFMPQPTRLDGRKVRGGLPGLDANSQTLHSPQIRFGQDITSNNAVRNYDLKNGIRTKINSIGAEMSFDVGNGFQISNKTRYSDISGDFLAPFAHQVTDADTLLANNFGGATATFFNGPNAGQAVTSASLRSLTGNNLITEVSFFDTQLKDMSNFANELKINRVFDFEGGSLDVTAGYFKMTQNITQDWHWNQFLVSTENNASLIDVAGATQNGILGYNRGFGWNGNNRLYDLDYDMDSPFVNATLSLGQLTLDGGLREDIMHANGGGIPGTGGNFDVNGDGTIGPAETNVSIPDPGNPFIQNFRVSKLEYTGGVNYLVNDGLSVFARYSQGASFNGERKFFSDQINQFSGKIANKGSFVDVAKQLEGGFKWRESDAVPGDLDLYVTFFYARTEESNFEITTMRSLDNKYRSKGIETEFNYSNGGFNLLGTFTWTDANIHATASGANIGHTPRRQADLIYNFTPSYSYQDVFRIGANINGTTKTYVDDDNNLIMPAFTTVNLFASVNISERASISINANNVFDAVGFTEAENGRAFDALTPGDGVNDVIVARSITGRTTTMTLSVRF